MYTCVYTDGRKKRGGDSERERERVREREREDNLNMTSMRVLLPTIIAFVVGAPQPPDSA